jgi:hypothetical protein
MARRHVTITPKKKAFVIRLSLKERQAVARVLKARAKQRKTAAGGAEAGGDEETVQGVMDRVLSVMCESRQAETSVIVIDVE